MKAVLCFVMAVALVTASCTTSNSRKTHEKQSNVGNRNELAEEKLRFRVEELLKRINENPDLLHGDATPAVLELTEIGLPSLKFGLLQLLLSDNPEERMRAERVLAGVTMEHLGIRLGPGLKDPNLEEQWRTLWRRNGEYDWKGSAKARGRSAIKWQDWLDRQN